MYIKKPNSFSVVDLDLNLNLFKLTGSDPDPEK
jgi:hypothetical protein